MLERNILKSFNVRTVRSSSLLSILMLSSLPDCGLLSEFCKKGKCLKNKDLALDSISGESCSVMMAIWGIASSESPVLLVKS